MNPLLSVRSDLDKLRCSEPGCDCNDQLVLGCNRHDYDFPTVAAYSKGELTLDCAECGAHVLTVPVAG
jgi:hypothetical protein